MNFPQRLQVYRKEMGLSQEALAEQLGVSRQSVSKWEQGSSFPETDKLLDLSSRMGLTLDELLRDGPAVPVTNTQTPLSSAPPDPARRWRMTAGVLIAAVLFLLVMLLYPHPQTSETNALETAPENSESAVFHTDMLSLLREWFFDFARRYRLDYMPTFTLADGPPTDAAEYLYWVYAVNLDNWAEPTGTMTRAYVEETVQNNFGREPGTVLNIHRTVPKAWGYDPQTETYTAWPESLRDLPYYLLDNITLEDEIYTIRATQYHIPIGYPTAEEDEAYRQAVLTGNLSDVTPACTVTVRFYLSTFSFDQPRFLSCEVEWN